VLFVGKPPEQLDRLHAFFADGQEIVEFLVGGQGRHRRILLQIDFARLLNKFFVLFD